MERRSFKKGKSFLEYAIIKHIWKGAFSDIYYVKDNHNSRYALKVEPKDMRNKKFIMNEVKVLKALQASSFSPKYKTAGITQNYMYVVEELLGPSLTTARKILPDAKFTLSTGLRIGIEMLKAIEILHNKGFIHRDIKPSNFLIRASRSTPIALIDYSLARVFVDPETKSVLPPRQKTGFVGTTKYASLNSHMLKDLAMRDDIISWFFSLLEMINGALPWTHMKDRDAIYQAKREFDTSGLPVQLESIYKCIIQYEFDERPNYKMLMAFLVEYMKEHGVSWSDPYDWEVSDCISRYAVIDLRPSETDAPNIPRNLPNVSVVSQVCEDTELRVLENDSYQFHESVAEIETEPNTCCTVQ